jgi:hypothetical protein
MPVKDPFLAGVLASMPEADRAKAEARLIELEEGGLRQADYSRLSAEAQATKKQFDDLHAKNLAWFTERQAALEEVDSLRARLADPARPDPARPNGDTSQTFKLPDDVITTKKLTEILNQTERGAVGFIAEANVLSIQHYKDFGEILNVTELATDPRAQQIGIQGVYREKFKEQLAAKAKTAADAQAEAFRLEGEKRAMERLSQQRGPGYPVVGNEPSSLDAIEAAVRSGDGKVQLKSLDDMAAEYARLSSTRAGAGSP